MWYSTSNLGSWNYHWRGVWHGTRGEGVRFLELGGVRGWDPHGQMKWPHQSFEMFRSRVREAWNLGWCTQHVFWARRLPQTVCRGFVQCEILRRRETIGYSDPVFWAQGTLFWIVLNATSRIVLNVLRPRGRSPFFIEFSCESPRKARAHWLSSGCIALRFDWYMHWHPKQKPMHFWTRSEVMRVSWV